jgi:hypothetical protein
MAKKEAAGEGIGTLLDSMDATRVKKSQGFMLA